MQHAFWPFREVFVAFVIRRGRALGSISGKSADFLYEIGNDFCFIATPIMWLWLNYSLIKKKMLSWLFLLLLYIACMLYIHVVAILSLVMVRETSDFIRTMVLLFNFTLSCHYLKIQNIQCFIMTMPLNMVLIMHTITRIFSCDVTKLIILCWCTQTQRTNSWATEHCCDVAIISSNMKPVS